MHFSTWTLAVAVVVMLPRLVGAADTIWAVGPAFEKQLQTPVGITWAANPIRPALARLAETQQVAVLLDRRIDPELKVEFAIQGAPLHELFDRLGKQQGWGVSYMGSVVYLGPTPTARKLATLAALRVQQASALAEAQRRRYLAAAALQWDELTTPRELVERVCLASGLRLVNPERIPHDLWPAGSWPALSTIDKLTLLLAGFDLTFDISPDGTAIRPAAMPERVSIQRGLGRAANLEQLARQLGERFPEVKLAVEGGQLVGAGTVEELELIERALRGERVRPNPVAAPGAKQVFTLRVENKPAGGILQALAKQLGLQIEFAPEIPPQKLAELVSFEVKEASLEELFQKAAAPAGLRCTVTGKTVKVTAE